MRILVMLNPPNRYGTKGAYTELRKFLISDGFIKIQNEVFMRVENSKKSCLKHQNKIKSYLPTTGEIRMFILTERQFENCILFQEQEDLQEKLVGAKDLVLL